MRLFSLAALLLLSACSPSLNWRDTRFDPDLVALLPCQPDRASRAVVLAGHPVTLQMAGCEAAGATFAVMLAPLDDAGAAPAALQGWREATLANMHGQVLHQTPYQRPGSVALPASLRLSAAGRRADGRAVQAQAVWLAWPRGQGVLLVHAVLYADTLPPEAAQTLFDGLRRP